MRVILFLCLAALLAPAPAQAQGQTFQSWLRNEFRLFRVYPRLDRAERFYQQTRYDEARVMLSQVLSIEPENIQALRLLIETCQQLQDFDCIDKNATALLNQPTARAIGAYYLMLKARRSNTTMDIIHWGEIALSDSRSHLSDSERSIVFAMLERSYEQISQAELFTLLTNQDASNSADTGITSIPFLTSQQAIGLDLRQGVYPINLEDFLSDPANIKRVAIDEQIFWLHSLAEQGQLESALVIAMQLPDSSDAHNLQANLLEKMQRHAEAAMILENRSSEREKLNPQFWQRLFNLYELAGDRSSQINVMVQAHDVLKADPSYLELASVLFINQSNQIALDAAFEVDSAEFNTQKTQIQRLLSLINTSRVSASADNYQAFRLDAEIMLAGMYLDQGDDDSAWAMVQDILVNSDPDFNQAQSLASVIWSLNRCPTVITDAQATGNIDALPLGRKLILASCYRRTGALSDSYALVNRMLDDDVLSPQGRNDLIRNQGFLAMELNMPASAIDHWKVILDESPDAQIALSSAYAASLLDEWTLVEDYLDSVDTRSLAPAGLNQYWQTRARLAIHNGDTEAAIASYQQALSLERGNLDSWIQLFQVAESAGDVNTANNAWLSVLELAPQNSAYHAEYAYFLVRQDQPQDAIFQFKQALALTPGVGTLQRDLVFAQLDAGQYEDAVATLETIIDSANTNGINDSQLYADKLLYTNISRRWTIEASEVVRLDNGTGAIVNPGLRNSSYRGYGSLTVNYLPLWGQDDINDQRVILTSRMFWGNPDQSLDADTDAAILAVGARYKLFNDHAVFVSAEHLIGLGNQAQDDNLLRLSGSVFTGLDWPYADNGWLYRNLYLDAAYFTRSNVKYATLEYERGKIYRFGGDSSHWGYMPFVRLGGTINNDNPQSKHESRIDAGIGISLVGRHFPSEYKNARMASRISLVFSQKLAGNTQDESAIHFRFNLSH